MVLLFIFDLDTIGWWDLSVVFHNLFSFPSTVFRDMMDFPILEAINSNKIYSLCLR